jgi:hypothetical protein
MFQNSRESVAEILNIMDQQLKHVNWGSARFFKASPRLKWIVPVISTIVEAASWTL